MKKSEKYQPSNVTILKLPNKKLLSEDDLSTAVITKTKDQICGSLF